MFEKKHNLPSAGTVFEPEERAAPEQSSATESQRRRDCSALMKLKLVMLKPVRRLKLGSEESA